MRIVHLPFDGRNPYQSLLAQALAEAGVTVIPQQHQTWRLLDSMLLRWHADGVHFHWLDRFVAHRARWRALVDFPLLFLQLAVLKLLRKRIAWTVHNLQGHDSRSPLRERWLAMLIGRFADVVFVHGELAAVQVRECFGLKQDRIVQIDHGHYMDWYPASVSHHQARQKLGIAPGKAVLLFFGNIRPYKGVVELVKAFQSLQRMDVELIIAGQPGDPELTRELQTLAACSQGVRLYLQFIPDDEVQVFLHAADAVVFPYHEILTSGALVLAMGFGRACIAPRRGCIPELLDDQGGYLYDPQAADGLVEALTAALRCPERLTAMGAHNKSRAARWTWQQVAQRTLSGYSKQHQRNLCSGVVAGDIGDNRGKAK